MSNPLVGIQSLVKYSTPQLVSTAGKQKEGKKQKIDSLNKESHRTEDILTQILPQKEVVLENGQLWVQTVLSTPATRTEVIQLQEELDRKLTQRQARDTGICPIREQLFEQCFDELIRQITIDCRQRGLLLVRVRDEFQSQLEAYKTLYESSIAYGMRKMIDSEKRKSDINTENMMLERECQDLLREVEELEQKIEFTTKQENAKLDQDNETHRVEVEKNQGKQLQIKGRITEFT